MVNSTSSKKHSFFVIISCLALGLSLFTIFSYPQKTQVNTSPSILENIQKTRVIRVGYVKFAPCAYVNPKTGELEGIFIDATKEIADELKVKVEFKETTLANFSAALSAGEFDYSIGPTFITPNRALSVAFTQPILALGNSGLVKSENTQKFQNISSLAQPNLRIAVLQGQAMEQFIKVNFPKAKLIVISGSDLTAPLTAVEAGQADIGLTNSVTVQNYASSRPNTSIVFNEKNSLARLALAWVVPSDDLRLQSFLNSSIDWLVQSGKLEQIEAKYKVRLSSIQ